MFSIMKKFNVYPEIKYIIISIPFILAFFGLFALGIIFKPLMALFLLSSLAALVIAGFLLFFGIPNTMHYYNCKKSTDYGKATVVDKFEKISKNEEKNDKWIIVLEYRINGICYRSANIITKDIAKDLELKDVVDVAVSNNMALFVKKSMDV